MKYDASANQPTRLHCAPLARHHAPIQARERRAKRTRVVHVDRRRRHDAHRRARAPVTRRIEGWRRLCERRNVARIDAIRRARRDATDDARRVVDRSVHVQRVRDDGARVGAVCGVRDECGDATGTSDGDGV